MSKTIRRMSMINKSRTKGMLRSALDSREG